MKNIIKNIIVLSFLTSPALANHKEPTPAEIQFYRDLTLKVRTSATFKVPMPSGSDMLYNYQLNFADPVYPEPMIGDLHEVDQNKTFTRSFFDRILLKEGSFVNIGGEKLPLTCIFVVGQDNRFAGQMLPTFPLFVMKVYLVANDFSCTGPLTPGWPENGGKEEAWDTYVFFEVKDPTIMLPVEAKVRFRWNEFKSVLVK